MLWELEQLEKRLQEIELERKSLERDTGISARDRRKRLAENWQESSKLWHRRQEIRSHVEQDPALQRALDAKLVAEAEAKRSKAPPEAELGPKETPGKISGKEANPRDLYQKYAKKWHERSVSDRANESAKMLEHEREPDWEP